MDKGTFLVALMVGAALLALWVDARLGDRCPQSFGRICLHCGGAFLALEFVGALAPKLIQTGSLPTTLLALFVMVLPGWCYSFLASLWFLKLLRSAIPR